MKAFSKKIVTVYQFDSFDEVKEFMLEGNDVFLDNAYGRWRLDYDCDEEWPFRYADNGAEIEEWELDSLEGEKCEWIDL